MSQQSEKLIELLRHDYPDISGWTIICANDRAVDPVQYYIHSELGGILPRVEGLKTYIAKKNKEKLKLEPVPVDELFLYFISFISEQLPNEAYPARRAVSYLPVITKLAEYKIDKNSIYGAERFTDNEWAKLEEYLETAQAFRQWLAKLNLFMPEMEMVALENIEPGEKELFIGLPEMTPVTEKFYRKIKKERLFIDRALYGTDLSGPEKLPFDSAKNLILSFGGQIASSDGAGLELISLAGLHSLVDMVTLEVSSFLKERRGREQLMIFLLDESITPMLWYRSLRFFGDAVNLAVWLPFSTTSAGKRLLLEIENAVHLGRMPDFRKFATICAVELSQNRENYVREECEALETAISFASLLDFWKERLGRNFADSARTLVETRKLRVTGSRSAPIQVVGFGHVSGEKFSRGLILSLDAGVMPSLPFECPFINPVHVPQLRRNVFEYEDLIFRQILAQGEKIKIVGINDRIRERTPSYYMSFLAQEFRKPISEMAFKVSARVRRKKVNISIILDDNIKKKLRNYKYSYSSLTKILACPFLFYHQCILGINPPAFMDDDEKINMRMGDFVHRFLKRLSTSPKKKFDDWESLFDELWESDDNLETRSIEGVNIYMLNAKLLLHGIYNDERETGVRLVFADNALSCEKKFEGKIDGCYKITGRSDRIASIDGCVEVIDFKYAKRQDKYDLKGKKTVLERFREENILHPAAQLIIYQHFNKDTQGARFYFLREPTQNRQIELPAAEISRAGALMQAIRERLDQIIGGSELAPNYESDECEYCQFKVLCGREDYYRTVRENR